MFTGIIECVGQIINVTQKDNNKILTISHPMKDQLYIDQSISHNGVCLTVISISNNIYQVEAIEETLRKTNLSELKSDNYINIERSLVATTRMDGHIVSGHIDCFAEILEIKDQKGSWEYRIKLPKEFIPNVVTKGSICINGISLTVSSLDENSFCVSIIPYTFNHTNLKYLKAGDKVNLEFDVIGKYVINYLTKINS